MKARFPGNCPVCGKDFKVTDPIDQTAEGWAHYRCVNVKPPTKANGKKKRNGSASALKVFEANKKRIESGETYRGQKPSDYRRNPKRK